MGTIRWGWNKDAFLRGEAGGVAGNTTSNLADSVDDAVTSNYWWGWVIMIDQVLLTLRKASAWADSCSCHSDMLAAVSRKELEVTAEVVKRLQSCPMRCRRAAEIASEEFLQIIESSAEATAAELIISLPGNLTAAERRSAVEDFDLARAHLTFYFTSKLAYTAEEPWNVVILSHFDQHKARAAGRNVLRSRHPHPLMLRLRTDLRGQMQAWIGGAPLLQFKELAAVICGLRGINTRERPAEGQHAKQHKRGLGRHCHTEAFMSYGLRKTEYVQEIQANQTASAEFAFCCQCVPNAEAACEAAGFSKHPAIQEQTRERNMFRHPIYGRVIYHADGMTLYRSPPPAIGFNRDNRPGPGAGEDECQDNDAGGGDGAGGGGDGHGGGGDGADRRGDCAEGEADGPKDNVNEGSMGSPGFGACSGDQPVNGVDHAAGSQGQQSTSHCGGSGSGQQQGQRGDRGELCHRVSSVQGAGGGQDDGNDEDDGRGHCQHRHVIRWHHGAFQLLLNDLLQFVNALLKHEQATYFSLPLHQGTLSSLR